MKKLNKKSIKANRQLRPIKASYDAYTEDLSDFGHISSQRRTVCR